MAGSIDRRGLLGVGAALAGAALAGPLAPAAAADAPRRPGPDTIATPPGFQPEGVAISAGGTLYTGSILDGSIYRADLATGTGRVITQGTGPISVGLKLDRRGRLLVAGGDSGELRVVHAGSGRVLATHRAATGTTFVNDVVVGCGGAWFTDSFRDVLYHLPEHPGAEPAELRLGGEWPATPPGGAYWGSNGIGVTPDGRALLVVNDTAEALFRVDPRTGRAVRTVLEGAGSVANGDGLLVRGRTLYAVRNWSYAVDVFALSGDGSRAVFTRRITDERFDEPTTAALHRGRLYVVNARFDSDWSDPATSSTIVAVPA
ncbi:SMP-30/gluconolactonase/LRE family protein [Streptomyces sp. NPDC089919]|uniref:SMP-30/gluconolactonase/LRE family protein n=1 Tax=Streptomyces sp. NPDC089919 TaxID=3155188 RepID=UPI003436DE47